ncbi:hypothetical protein lbkm_1097 [Lachnospiraceae bacterium KM106-2]|nr:hypothetical protein lbkm_1097 [Lachnospiraceae bacterium KM106-2]
MSEFSVEHFISNICLRTKKNLNYIDETNQKDKSVYELTQLINSLFALLIMPVEKYKSINDGYEPNAKKYKEYKDIESIINECKKNKFYRSTYTEDYKYPVTWFIRHIRNALAHSGDQGIHFIPLQEKKDIKYIIFYDTQKKNLKGQEIECFFCVKLSIIQIHNLAIKISELYANIENESKNKITEQLYNNEIDTLKRFLESGEEPKDLKRNNKKK